MFHFVLAALAQASLGAVGDIFDSHIPGWLNALLCKMLHQTPPAPGEPPPHQGIGLDCSFCYWGRLAAGQLCAGGIMFQAVVLAG